MVTYNNIEAANKKITTTDIKGKDYAEVPQRIKAFRMCYPMGFISTEMLSNENGVCVFKSSVGFYDDKGEPQILGTGTAYEKEGSTFINKTSYIENCETSAVGRALGMAGFGIDTSIASAEEVQNAMLNQEDKQKAIASQPQRKTANKDKNSNVPEGEVKPEEEMTKPGDIITPAHVKAVRARIETAAKKGKNLDEPALCKMLKIESFEQMNYGQLNWFNNMMEKNGV